MFERSLYTGSQEMRFIPFTTILLLTAVASDAAAQSRYQCEVSERVTESGRRDEDFGRFELVIEAAGGAPKSAVLRQVASAGAWRARFVLQSHEAGTLWFDVDGSFASPDGGVESLSLNLEDGALGVYFEWSLPTPPGEPSRVIAYAALAGRCEQN